MLTSEIAKELDTAKIDVANRQLLKTFLYINNFLSMINAML